MITGEHMGIEYRVPLDTPVSQEWDHVLRAAPYFSHYNQPYRLYEFRSPNRPNLDAMPDVVVAIKPNGLYFCDNGNRTITQAILNDVRAAIIAAGTTFVVEDYE
jgi:hypothetical protein